MIPDHLLAWKEENVAIREGGYGEFHTNNTNLLPMSPSHYVSVLQRLPTQFITYTLVTPGSQQVTKILNQQNNTSTDAWDALKKSVGRMPTANFLFKTSLGLCLATCLDLLSLLPFQLTTYKIRNIFLSLPKFLNLLKSANDIEKIIQES